MTKEIAAQYVLNWARYYQSCLTCSPSEDKHHEKELANVFAALGVNIPATTQDIPEWNTAKWDEINGQI